MDRWSKFNVQRASTTRTGEENPGEPDEDEALVRTSSELDAGVHKVTRGSPSPERVLRAARVRSALVGPLVRWVPHVGRRPNTSEYPDYARKAPPKDVRTSLEDEWFPIPTSRAPAREHHARGRRRRMAPVRTGYSSGRVVSSDGLTDPAHRLTWRERLSRRTRVLHPRGQRMRSEPDQVPGCLTIDASGACELRAGEGVGGL